MYSMENYFWGGVGYVLGVLLVTPLLWRCTRWLHWRPLIALVRILVLTILLVPVRAFPDKAFLAPAWAVAVFEHIQPTGIEGAVRGMLPIAACFLGAYGLYLLAFVWWRRRPAAVATASGATAAVGRNPSPAAATPGRGARRKMPSPRAAPGHRPAGLPTRADWGNRRD